jgi:hypothetical protein
VYQGSRLSWSAQCSMQALPGPAILVTLPSPLALLHDKISSRQVPLPLDIEYSGSVVFTIFTTSAKQIQHLAPTFLLPLLVWYKSGLKVFRFPMFQGSKAEGTTFAEVPGSRVPGFHCWVVLRVLDSKLRFLPNPETLKISRMAGILWSYSCQ